MDAQRAQEISTSPTMVNVSFNGQQVYIEHVDQSNDKATIHPVDKPENKQSVPINSLMEQ